MKEVESCKWQIVISNPDVRGYTLARIIEIFCKLENLIYGCVSDEVGMKSNILHTHIYLHFSSAVRFSVIKNNFYGAYIEVAVGSAQQNADYVFKTGKWSNKDLFGVKVKLSHYQFGDMTM